MVLMLVLIFYDVDDFGKLIQEYNKKFKRIWPLCIYPCQKIDFFGEKMCAVPYFQVHVSRMLWVFKSLILHLNHCGILFLRHKYEGVNGKDTS